jgi:hypothetical protein
MPMPCVLASFALPMACLADDGMPMMAIADALRPLPSLPCHLCLDALMPSLALPFSASPCYAIFGVVYFCGIKKG